MNRDNCCLSVCCLSLRTGIIVAYFFCCLSCEQVIVAYLFVVFLVNRYNYCLSVCCLSCEQVMVAYLFVVFLVNRDKCCLSVCCLSCVTVIIIADLIFAFLVNR